MGRPLRIEEKGYWYHITARGQRQEKIFQDNSDYAKYLEILNNFRLRYNITVGAFCLMPNHVHLLLRCGEKGLSSFFLSAHTKYAKYFNKKYFKKGHVFQGRYHSKIVLSEKYLTALVRYIHGNPVRAGLVKPSEEY